MQTQHACTRVEIYCIQYTRDSVMFSLFSQCIKYGNTPYRRNMRDYGQFGIR